MRFFTLLLFMPLFSLAQTPAERQKIVATYDQQKIAALRAQGRSLMVEQQKLINDFRLANPDLKESQSRSLQRIYDGIPLYFTTYNAGSSQTINADDFYAGGMLGVNVFGQGMTGGVWDSGKVLNTHNEFSGGKVILNDASTDLSDHATHVTGTMVASGVSAIRRGIAYGAQALTHDWDSDYTEMIEFGAAGYLVSNHSYGYLTDELPLWKYGSYDGSSIEIDNLSNTYPFYQVVIAAGNDRNSGSEQDNTDGGYDLLSGTGVAKNGLTVAAIHEMLVYTDSSTPLMSMFSNFGPPDDGRIKPEVAAKGVSVSSTISSGSYAEFNGTSMAAPAVSAMILLMQQHHNNIYASFMKAATVRGLLCHTAREAGFYQGPDYEYGYGVADGFAAGALISNKNISNVLEENTLTNGQTYTKQIALASPQQLTATLAWTDPVGNQNSPGQNDTRTPRLRNNLDLKIIKDGVTYYPWKLNADEPYLPPTREDDNNVDNLERIDIDFAEPGIYTIQVTHKSASLVNGAQNYSLIVSGSAGLALAVERPDFAGNIVVYPNPVKNQLNFSIPQNGTAANVGIFDILGKEISTVSQPVNNAMDVSSLSSGIYFVKFTVDGKSSVRKFVKE